MARILERDGHRCYLCGGSIAEGQGTADHVVALARGGSDDESNLKAAHRRCNAAKAATADRRRA